MCPQCNHVNIGMQSKHLTKYTTCVTMAFETKDRSKNDTNFDTCNNYKEEVTISTFNLEIQS